jgi:hypothetical protein
MEILGAIIVCSLEQLKPSLHVLTWHVLERAADATLVNGIFAREHAK